MANILIVEDEPIAAWSIREALEAAGHTIVNEVASGSQAILWASQHQPDVVLMDIRLSDETDGLEAAQTIAKDYSIPIVFLTAHADDATIQRALETSPFGYVVKPFRRRELMASIDIAIRRHQREQRLVTANSQLTTTLESIGDAVITVDLEGESPL
jgi:CheY-like chemotaxis protein